MGPIGVDAGVKINRSLSGDPMLSPKVKELLEAGVHFGHQTRRWNPKMKPFIFAARNGIYIIDLQKTVNALEQAKRKISEVVRSGRPILFVGTKKQAKEVIHEQAPLQRVFRDRALARRHADQFQHHP